MFCIESVDKPFFSKCISVMYFIPVEGYIQKRLPLYVRDTEFENGNKSLTTSSVLSVARSDLASLDADQK